VTQRSTDTRSDTELLAAHAAGDTAAFGEVVRRHRDRLWAVALRTLGDREEAADALQDALVSALRASGSRTGEGAAFRGESAVTTWLHRIVVNACLDRVRRRASHPTDPLPERDLPARGPDPLAARELAIDLDAALATLPVEQRAALVLVDMYGYPVDDVAVILECAVGTVKSRCARGRARLLPLLRPAALPDQSPDHAPDHAPDAAPDREALRTRNPRDPARVPPTDRTDRTAGTDPPAATEGGDPLR
jgi:RNA polymerase sigma-70 factor (ECF subfamily)